MTDDKQLLFLLRWKTQVSCTQSIDLMRVQSGLMPLEALRTRTNPRSMHTKDACASARHKNSRGIGPHSQCSVGDRLTPEWPSISIGVSSGRGGLSQRPHLQHLQQIFVAELSRLAFQPGASFFGIAEVFVHLFTLLF